jgi:hypothetical protein
MCHAYHTQLPLPPLKEQQMQKLSAPQEQVSSTPPQLYTATALLGIDANAAIAARPASTGPTLDGVIRRRLPMIPFFGKAAAMSLTSLARISSVHGAASVSIPGKHRTVDFFSGPDGTSR